MKPMKQKRTMIILLLAVLLAAVLACAVYAGDYYRADETALAALESGGGVTVYTQADGSVVFAPEAPKAGFIFYPGGKVEHTAYAPLMRALAEQGVQCVLVEMPLRLAVLDMDAAEGVREQFPEVERWYLGGHSLGGAMAASHAAEHADDYEGLVLLAAYSTADLTGSGLRVLSLTADQDQVLNWEKYEAGRAALPANAAEYTLEGGCHGGFGSYGPQEGDGVPTVTGAEQTAWTARQAADFMLAAAA